MALLQQGYAMDESGTQILDTYNKGLPYFELLGLIVKRLSSGFINYFFLLFYFKICSLIYHFWWYTFSFWRFLIFLCCSLFLLLCTWCSTCQALVIGSWTRYYHFFNIFFYKFGEISSIKFVYTWHRPCGKLNMLEKTILYLHKGCQNLT